MVSRLSTPVPLSTLQMWYVDGLDRKLQYEVATSSSACTTLQEVMQKAELVEHALARYKTFGPKQEQQAKGPKD